MGSGSWGTFSELGYGHGPWAKEKRLRLSQAVREAPWCILLIWPTVGQRDVLGKEKGPQPRHCRASKKPGPGSYLGQVIVAVMARFFFM